MTDEKKPPSGGVDLETVNVAGKKPPTQITQLRLVRELYAIDHAFQVAVLAARSAGENALLEELTRRWEAYEVLLAPLGREPAKLFE